MIADSVVWDIEEIIGTLSWAVILAALLVGECKVALLFFLIEVLIVTRRQRRDKSYKESYDRNKKLR